MNRLQKLFSKILRKKHLTNSNSDKSFDEIYNDLGCFKYDEVGFILDYENFNASVKWDEITQLNVYKKDLITIDQIEMQIVAGQKYFTISEELPGWFQFIIKTKEMFPTIPKDWDMKIINPPFQANFTTIYEKPSQN
ncbi:hypothetical protein HYN48_13820 [Flavobacterium magnum]|uniref:Uncharacterized protein n=1 Tax=Flavobacterium magnum TaxID=2162713 RepID=A0A2S0RGL5_9FLAO|nr:hypothetical protein [Flavobacterium magnum]AWA31077.1 hypothetical protein HYN48_13820 [Flavobacterium magnum]